MITDFGFRILDFGFSVRAALRRIRIRNPESKAQNWADGCAETHFGVDDDRP